MLKIRKITIEKLKSGKLKKELPEFYELKKIIENNSWHNNESTFNHTLNVLNDLQKFLRNNKNVKLKKYLDQTVDVFKRKDLLFLATVFHDLGKKETIIKNGKLTSFPEHEKISILKSKNILKNFDLSKKENEIVLGIIKYHSDLHLIVEEENKNLTKQFDKLMKTNKNFSIELIIMVMADTAGSYLKKTAPERYNFRMNFYKEQLKK